MPARTNSDINSALAALLAAAITPLAAAQLTITNSTFTVANPGSPQAVSVPASPNAAYSNLTNSPFNISGSGGGLFSDVAFDDITAASGDVGQRVQAIRAAAYFEAAGGSPPLSISVRLQVAFWNADGVFGTTTGLPGTPLLNGSTQAAYVSAPLTMVRGQFGVFTLNLGESGFVLPAGRFFIGLALAAATPTTSVLGANFSLAGPPVVGSSASGYYTRARPGGIPFNQAFPPSGSLEFPFGPGNEQNSLATELVVPSPSTAAFLGMVSMTILRRRR